MSSVCLRFFALPLAPSSANFAFFSLISAFKACSWLFPFSTNQVKSSSEYQPIGRYYAHLDSLHTITKPPAEPLLTFLREKRIATLTDEFRHDLHLRFFSAFASLG